MAHPFKFRPNVHSDEEARGLVSYATLEEAADDPDATLVISGDWGLTIYLTAPARLVRANAKTLWVLLSDLDAVYWMTGDFDIATVALLRARVGIELRTPDGSRAAVIDGVWTDDHFAREVQDQAREVVLGMRPRIDLTLLRVNRDREIDRRRVLRSANPQYALGWDFDISPPQYPFWPIDSSTPRPS